MPLRDFWTSIRTAAGFLLPTVVVDSPRYDAEQLETALRNAHVWLTSRAVEGFEEADFDFLPRAEQEKLAECVAQFVAAASQVPPDQPATTDQVDAALTPFLGILSIIRPDKYADLDAFVIAKRLEQKLAERLPEWVKQLRFETGDDVSDDPAIWIWVELDDDAAQESVFARNARQMRQLIAETIRELGIERWPYIRFRTASEQEAVHRDNAG